MWNKACNVWDAQGLAPLRCRFSTMARAGGPGRAPGAPRCCCCPGCGAPGPPCPSSKGTFPSHGSAEKRPRSRFLFCFWPFLLRSLTGNAAVVEDISHAYVAFINNECVIWIISFWRGTWEFWLTIRVSQLLLEWEFWLNQEICSPPRCSCPWWFLYSVAHTPLLCWFPWAVVHVNI